MLPLLLVEPDEVEELPPLLPETWPPDVEELTATPCWPLCAPIASTLPRLFTTAKGRGLVRAALAGALQGTTHCLLWAQCRCS